MTRIEVLRHYSVGSFGTLEAAEKRRAQIAARYPGREYTIMANGRTLASKYKVEQIKKVVIDLPDPEKDLHAPEPKRSDYAGRSKDYWDDQVAWRQHIDAIMKPILAPLTEKMNP